MLDHLVLIAFACVGIASIFYLFYWNRLVARFLGWIIQFLFWSQGASSIWVHIGSVQLSLLSGRILLKDVRYHSSNQTIRIVMAQIIWKFWLRRTLSDGSIGTMFTLDEKSTTKEPSCRIQITLQGYEWFLYNRTAAYEAILSHMASQDATCYEANQSRRSMDTRQCRHTYSPAGDFDAPIPSPYAVGALPLRTPTFVQDAIAWIRRQLPNLDPKELMPIGIDVSNGVITCGNASTPSLLVAEFSKTSGNFGLIRSRSKFDLYKQLLTLGFRNVVIHMVENRQYGDSMPAVGEMIQEQAELHGGFSTPRAYMSYHRFGKLWKRLDLFRFFGKFLNKPSTSHHRSFARKAKKSLDEDTPIGVDFSTLEYAIERKILQTPSLEVSYYVDAAGEVPPLYAHTQQPGIDPIGNGDAGPEWGIDMIVKGGFIRYGPWADRQRGDLHRIFFPQSFHDAEETPRLQPGDERLWTGLKIFIELRDETTLHVPFREASKNWQWDGLTEFRNRPKQREHAVIRLSAGDRSSIHYTMPMIANTTGYESTLEVHLDTLEVTSSLNDIHLVSAESCRVRCELPSPLKWDALRTWSIKASLRQPILFLLRDHINMIADLGKDWSSGLPSDFFRFVPTIYRFNLEMHRFELNLYANDHNIIDKPLVKDDNAFLILRGSSLQHELTIPSDVFRPSATKVALTMDIPDLAVCLSLPKWHTHAMHSPEEGTYIGTLDLHLDGSYQYFANVNANNTEQLQLTLGLSNVIFTAIGWSVRYFMIVRENYFGSFTHFSTLYEYLERRNRGLPPGDPDLDKYRPGTSNMMQVTFMLNVHNGLLLLPAGLPGYEGGCRAGNDAQEEANIGHCLALDIPVLQAYLRLHDYFMDFSLNIAPVSGKVIDRCYEKFVSSADRPATKPMIIIDGIDITAHRMFGPPPRTVTYICVWEISIGCVKGTLSAASTAIAVSALTAFRLDFADAPNAPAAEYMLATYPDVTFVKVSVVGVDLVWKVDTAAVHVSLPKGLRIDNNNLGGKFHRTLTSLRIPEVSAKALACYSTQSNRWLEAASMNADVDVDIYTSPAGWREAAEKQLNFVTEQDRLTGRAAEMLKALWSDWGQVHAQPRHMNGVYIPRPLPTHSSRFLTRTRQQGLANTTLPQSDSDDDVGLTEVDWDALVAQRRSENVSSVKDDECDMSGGDESDDDGVSDGGTGSSDWSDSEKATVDQDYRLYSWYTRHYSSHFVENPALWDDCPFNLIKDYKSNASERKQATVHFNRDCDRLPDNAIEVTVFRIVCRKVIDVRVTPLTIPILDRLQDDVESIPFAPELTVDSLLANHMGRILKTGKPRHCNVLDVDVASIQLHFPQRLDSTSGRTALCDLVVDSTHVIASLQKSKTSVHATSKSMELEYRVVGDRNGPVLCLQLSDTSGRLDQGVVAGRAGVLVVDVRHEFPEYTVMLAMALVKHVEELKSVGRRRKQHALQNNVRVMRTILTSDKDDFVLDPLSAIQPSYLVQSGIPHDLRTDPIFRFLCHLRGCLWDIRGWDERDPAKRLELPQLVPLLEKRLLALDPDAYHISRLTLLETLFLGLHKFSDCEVPLTLGFPAAALSLHFDQLILRVVDPSGGPAGSIAFRDLLVAARPRLLDLLEGNTLDSRLSFTPETAPSLVRTISVTLSMESNTLTVYPHLMGFAQNLLRAQKSPALKIRANAQEASKTSSLQVLFMDHLDLSIFTKTLRVQAIAANLIFEFGIETFQSNSSILFRRGYENDMNHAALCSTVFLRARSLSEEPSHADDDILASLDFLGCKANVIVHRDPLAGNRIRLAYDLKSFHFSIPRSALRLYRFFQDWQNDFIPGFRSAMRELVVELKQIPEAPTDPSRPKEGLNLQVNGHVGSFAILLQVMHGTWISWDVRSITIHLNATSSSRASQQQVFGVDASSQTFSIFPKSDYKDLDLSAQVKLDLPPLSVGGRWDGECIRAVALVEFLDLKVKPSHWDTLMTVQQKFGQDFNDFLTLIQEERKKRQTFSTPKKHSQSPPPLNFVLSVKIRGFRIGLEGLSSTIFLECLDIIGGLDTTSDRIYFVTFTDLALSLASRTSVATQKKTFNRRLRSAFVILDFKVLARSPVGRTGSSSDTLHINVTKIHAVMQPSSMGQVGDFIDDMQSEVMVRREQRAHELAAFKQRTQKILESFEIKAPTADVSQSAATSFFDNYSVDLKIANVGVAFPLTHDDQLNLPRHGSQDSQPVRAFLFSITSIQFGTVRGVTGEATMKGFSFQFIHRFRQSIAADFLGELHQTRNRLVYPEMTASLRSIRSATSRKLLMKANVSGFILDLDSTIPDYIFSLIDVYRQGKESVDQLSQTKPFTPIDPLEPAQEEAIERPKGVIPTSIFCGSLSFLSGRVRTYSAVSSQQSRRGPLAPTDDQVLDVGGEVFCLPEVSVWMEYRATPASHKYGNSDDQDTESSLLIFKATVHSSQNTLRPTMLPFLTELVNRVEQSMREGSSCTHLVPPTPSIGTVALPPSDSRQSSSMRISFSLRIDQSRLELTCKPDVNVIAALHWDSGGFVINISPRARNVIFTGSVGGLTVGLRHGFLSEDCVSLDARNLAFSLSFSKLDAEPRRSINSVSLVLDTEFLGGVRFSRLQDILCFKAVWLDRIPTFNAAKPTTANRKAGCKLATPDVSQTLPPKPEYSTILLVRIRQIKLDVDLGQSISVVVIDMRDSILRTKLTQSINEVSLSVADLLLTARGNVGGKLHVEDCVFQTIRRIEHHGESMDSHNRLLELRMTSGPIIIALESEHRKLLHYRAEPLAVEIFDDWSKKSGVRSTDKPLRLSFTIVGDEIVAAATIGTIPQILSYVNKFKANLEMQKEGASRDSKTFRATRAPQPDNPLSAVAEAMIYSARNRYKEAEHGLLYIIRQHMSVRLGLLRLIVFPRSMDDVEAAQFVGRSVRARLDRLVQAKAPSKKDILLSFKGMTISRFSQLGHTVSALRFSDNNDWLVILMKGASEATIVGLPAMVMHMHSQELTEDGKTILEYTFDSSFDRDQPMGGYEDIYIALNVGLYSWLAVLRKTLAREMDQVKAASDWRSTLSSSLNPTSLRRKGPEVVNNLPEVPRSAPAYGRNPTLTLLGEPIRSASAINASFNLPVMDTVTAATEERLQEERDNATSPSSSTRRTSIIYRPLQRHIERLNMRQLGEATPNVMHPFFMKKAGFSLEDSLPQYVNEYARAPLEEIMEALLKLYSRQLLDGRTKTV